MNAHCNHFEVRMEQGFDVYVLCNPAVEVAVVPELGAKIISVRNLRTGREWLWRPAGESKLFRNRRGDDFSRGTLIGADECLPTIAPCLWQGRQLPDHGEVWSAAWTVDSAAWPSGALRTRLGISPFAFERAIELTGNEIRLSYKLDNLNAAEECFLWAFHPLLKLEAGDRLELPSSTRSLLKSEAWMDDIAAAIPEGKCAKVFATPVTEGRARIANEEAGDWLEFSWDPARNNTLGLWLTRGGWHDHHHLAIEPTNGFPDALAVAALSRNCGVVAGLSCAEWQLRLTVGE